MKNVLLTLVALFASINLYSQTVNIQTSKSTDSYSLQQIDSSVIFNRQVFTSPDSVGVTAIFPAGTISNNIIVKIYKTQDPAIELIFDDIAEYYQILKKTNYEFIIDINDMQRYTDDISVTINLSDELKMFFKELEKLHIFQLSKSEMQTGFERIEYTIDTIKNTINIKPNATFINEDMSPYKNKIIIILGSCVSNYVHLNSSKRSDKTEKVLSEFEISSPFEGGCYTEKNKNNALAIKYGNYVTTFFRDPTYPFFKKVNGKDIRILHEAIDFGTFSKKLQIKTVASGKISIIKSYSDITQSYCWIDKDGKPTVGLPKSQSEANLGTGYGLTIIIDHENGYKTRYAHLSYIADDIYKAWANQKTLPINYPIGISGGVCHETGAGMSDGAHLHFELIKDEIKIDPKKFINNELNGYIKFGNIEYQTLPNKNQIWLMLDYNSTSSNQYGDYLTWNDAMKGSAIPKSQGVCPPGTHIPTVLEWEELKKSLSETPVSNFSSQFSGYKNESNLEFDKDKYAYYWTSDNNSFFKHNPSFVKIPKSNPNEIIIDKQNSVGWRYITKDSKLCVRCIKDAQPISPCDAFKKTIQRKDAAKILLANEDICLFDCNTDKAIKNQIVEISGSGFGTNPSTPPTIMYNYIPIPPISWTDQTIKLAIPESSNYGNTISIKPQTGGESNTVYLRVDEKATKPYPFLHFTSPTSTYEGEEVTIYGNNFGAYNAATSSLKLNDTPISIIPANWTTDKIIFKLPASSTSGNLLLQVEDRKSKPYYFQVMEKPAPTPYIYYIEPQMARVDDTVEINGLNFGSTLSTVTFNNGVKATPIAWSDKNIKLTVPAGATTGSVSVTINQDTSNQLYFVVLPPPQQPIITGISPANHFQTGATITISGNYFGYNAGGTDFVKFSAVQVETKDISDWYNTQITLKVPQCDTSGSVTITVGKLTSNGYGYKIDVPSNDSTGTITDTDNRVYTTKKFGNQWWMSENLRTGVRIDSATVQSQGNANVEKYNYQDNPANDSLGGLYMWNEAMNYSTTPGAQGICPNGWHIPTDEDWQELEKFLGMSVAESSRESVTQLDFRGTTEGNKLKIGGLSGFNAKMSGGWFDQYFGEVGISAYFWTSNTSPSGGAYSRFLGAAESGIGRLDDDKLHGYCIRCMQNK